MVEQLMDRLRTWIPSHQHCNAWEVARDFGVSEYIAQQALSSLVRNNECHRQRGYMSRLNREGVNYVYSAATKTTTAGAGGS